MKLLVAVLSKGRYKTIFKHTLRWLPRVGYDVRIFVEPQEIQAYRDQAKIGNMENYTDLRDDQFIDIQQNDQGLSYVKGFIKDYATEHGYELVFKMDDDIHRFSTHGKNKSDDEMLKDFIFMVGECRKTFGMYPDVAAIGFGYRNELYELKKWSAINARLQTAYLIRTEWLQSGFNTFEDFAQYIYIRAGNKVTLRYGLVGLDCADVGVNKGGLQAFDRKAQAQEEAERLKLIYPALQFKNVDKAWGIEPALNGEFFGVRKL